MPTAWTRLGGSSAPSGGSRPRGMHASPQSWIVAESAEGARSTTQKLGSAPSSPHPSNTKRSFSGRNMQTRAASDSFGTDAASGSQGGDDPLCVGVYRTSRPSAVPHTTEEPSTFHSAVQCVWSVTTLDNWIALPLEAIVATCSAPALSSARARVASVGCQRQFIARAAASVCLGGAPALPPKTAVTSKRDTPQSPPSAASLTSASVASSALRASANGRPPPISTSTLCSVAAAASVERPPEAHASRNSDSHAHRKPLAAPTKRAPYRFEMASSDASCLRLRFSVPSTTLQLRSSVSASTTRAPRKRTKSTSVEGSSDMPVSTRRHSDPKAGEREQRSLPVGLSHRTRARTHDATHSHTSPVWNRE